MKKILQILGSLSIISIGSLSAVSCGTVKKVAFEINESPTLGEHFAQWFSENNKEIVMDNQYTFVNDFLKPHFIQKKDITKDINESLLENSFTPKLIYGILSKTIKVDDDVFLDIQNFVNSIKATFDETGVTLYQRDKILYDDISFKIHYDYSDSKYVYNTYKKEGARIVDHIRNTTYDLGGQIISSFKEKDKYDYNFYEGIYLSFYDKRNDKYLDFRGESDDLLNGWDHPQYGGKIILPLEFKNFDKITTPELSIPEYMLDILFTKHDAQVEDGFFFYKNNLESLIKDRNFDYFKSTDHDGYIFGSQMAQDPDILYPGENGQWPTVRRDWFAYAPGEGFYIERNHTLTVNEYLDGIVSQYDHNYQSEKVEGVENRELFKYEQWFKTGFDNILAYVDYFYKSPYINAEDYPTTKGAIIYSNFRFMSDYKDDSTAIDFSENMINENKVKFIRAKVQIGNLDFDWWMPVTFMDKVYPD